LFDVKHLVDKTIKFVPAFLKNFETAEEVLRDSTHMVVVMLATEDDMLLWPSTWAYKCSHIKARNGCGNVGRLYRYIVCQVF